MTGRRSNRRKVAGALLATVAAAVLLFGVGTPAQAADQTVFNYGDAPYLGSTGDVKMKQTRHSSPGSR